MLEFKNRTVLVLRFACVCRNVMDIVERTKMGRKLWQTGKFFNCVGEESSDEQSDGLMME